MHNLVLKPMIIQITDMYLNAIDSMKLTQLKTGRESPQTVVCRVEQSITEH